MACVAALLAPTGVREIRKLLQREHPPAPGTPRQLTTARRGFDIRYTVQDFEVGTWNDLTTPPWPPPSEPDRVNLKQITLRVSSTTRILTGRREFVVSAIKIAG